MTQRFEGRFPSEANWHPRGRQGFISASGLREAVRETGIVVPHTLILPSLREIAATMNTDHSALINSARHRGFPDATALLESVTGLPMRTHRGILAELPTPDLRTEAGQADEAQRIVAEAGPVAAAGLAQQLLLHAAEAQQGSGPER